VEAARGNHSDARAGFFHQGPGSQARRREEDPPERKFAESSLDSRLPIAEAK